MCFIVRKILYFKNLLSLTFKLLIQALIFKHTYSYRTVTVTITLLVVVSTSVYVVHFYNFIFDSNFYYSFFFYLLFKEHCKITPSAIVVLLQPYQAGNLKHKLTVN